MVLQEIEKDPLKASSYGTGELILHALDAGFRKFIIGLGGSATNDGGVGILQALGMRFLTKQGNDISTGGEGLSMLEEIDSTHFDERIIESHFIIASDVTNPLVGPDGASFVFGPQKGATKEIINLLDRNLKLFADVVEKSTGHTLRNKKGAGAAGGAGGAFQAFFPSETSTRNEVVLDAISFKEQLKEADLIITGEGKTDGQTLSGKTPYGIAQNAKEKQVILISGAIDDESRSTLSTIFTELHAIVDETISPEESMKDAYHYLRCKTKKVVACFLTK